MKALVAYFSCSGVTKEVAARIAAVTDGDLFEIVPEILYSPADLDWNNKQSRSSVEMNNPASRPAIVGRVENMADYDTVFVGFPIWWYLAPTIISTFVESYDLSGKTLIPFATSESSGMGKSGEVLEALCPDTVRWLPGKLLARRESQATLTNWLTKLGLL